MKTKSTIKLTRRGLMRSGVALAAVAAAQLPVAHRARAASGADVASAEGEINVLGYQFYQADDVHNAGKVQASWSYVQADTELPPKLRPRGSFDVATMSLTVLDPLYKIDRFAPIDPDLLENYGDLDPTLRALYTKEDGSVWGVPYAVVPGQMGWNSDLVSEPKDIRDLLKPEYTGKVGLVDNAVLLPAYALALGLSSPERPELVTHESMEQVMAFLEELRSQVKTIFVFGDEPNLFARSDIAVAFQTFASFFTESPSMKFNFVGSISFVDAWGILQDGDHAKGISWINNFTTPEGLSAMAGMSYANPSNDESLDGLPEALRMPIADLVKASPPLGATPLEKGDYVSLPEMIEMWSAYKASFL